MATDFFRSLGGAGTILLLVFTALLALPRPASAQTAPPANAPTPTFNILPQIQQADGEEDYALPIQLLLLLTVLSVAPAIVIMTTSFTRLIVVFGLLRTALGTQQAPPSQLIAGLALFLTFFIMHPTLSQIHDEALAPYIAGEITQKQALDLTLTPMKAFMLSQTREKDLMLFMDLANVTTFNSADDVQLHILIPAYVISELRIAFQIGFMIFLPFLIVDLVVASVLMGMGMMMLPPIMVSLPLKLLLFVLSDGWYLIVESVIRGYTGT
ncbi:MAG: flagellar type III secretion system pore protein FliP [Rhodothermales bacterium]